MSIKIRKPCLHCNKLFDSKRSHGVYCSASCRTLYNRAKRSTTKTVTIGRLRITFTDCADKTIEQLHEIVKNALTPEILKLIHSDQPIQIGATQ